jgi:hypothetical protein
MSVILPGLVHFGPILFTSLSGISLLKEIAVRRFFYALNLQSEKNRSYHMSWNTRMVCERGNVFDGFIQFSVTVRLAVPHNLE